MFKVGLQTTGLVRDRLTLIQFPFRHQRPNRVAIRLTLDHPIRRFHVADPGFPSREGVPQPVVFQRQWPLPFLLQVAVLTQAQVDEEGEPRSENEYPDHRMEEPHRSDPRKGRRKAEISSSVPRMRVHWNQNTLGCVGATLMCHHAR